MSELVLKAVKREIGKQSLITSLKKSGMIPGIFYGHGVDNIAIAAKDLDLRPFIYTSESHVINLTIDGDSEPHSCIMKDVQYDPVKYKPIHFDLLALNAGEELELEIPVQIIGTAAGVREGGILQHYLHKLMVKCLPKHIPSHIELNVEKLNITDSIRVSDVVIENVNILNDANASVVAVIPRSVQAEETTTEDSATEVSKEPEVVAKGKKEKED